MATHGWQVLNGELTFLDVNGDPLTGGNIFFYTPGTTSPKDTFNDHTLTVTNANPVILDQAGRATIWGSGLYRQIVQDQFGNTQWDLTTGSDPGFEDLEAINATITNLTVTGSTNLANGASVGANGIVVNGAAVLNQGLDVFTAPGETVALSVSGNAQISGGLTLGNNLQVNGSDGGTTFSTGEKISVQGGNSPGFIMNNTVDHLIWGMWGSNNVLEWGAADGTPSGNVSSVFMTLDQNSNLTVHGDVFCGKDMTVLGLLNTESLVMGKQLVLAAGPSNGTNPIVLPAGAFVLYIAGGTS